MQRGIGQAVSRLSVSIAEDISVRLSSVIKADNRRTLISSAIASEGSVAGDGVQSGWVGSTVSPGGVPASRSRARRVSAPKVSKTLANVLCITLLTHCVLLSAVSCLCCDADVPMGAAQRGCRGVS